MRRYAERWFIVATSTIYSRHVMRSPTSRLCNNVDIRRFHRDTIDSQHFKRIRIRREVSCVWCSVRCSLFNANGGVAQLITAPLPAQCRRLASPRLAWFTEYPMRIPSDAWPNNRRVINGRTVVSDSARDAPRFEGIADVRARGICAGQIYNATSYRIRAFLQA